MTKHPPRHGGSAWATRGRRREIAEPAVAGCAFFLTCHARLVSGLASLARGIETETHVRRDHRGKTSQPGRASRNAVGSTHAGAERGGPVLQRASERRAD